MYNVFESLRPLKILASRVLAHPMIGRAVGYLYDDVIPFRGMRIDVRGSSFPPANKAALWWGMYESAECRMIQRYLLPDLPVIELGSSIGAVSSLIASRLRAGVRLSCVEGNPAVMSNLQRNLTNHARHLQVSVLQAAIAYGTDRVGFEVAGDNLISRLALNAARATVSVPCITLECLIAPFGQGPYQLVADIEGAEAAILTEDRKSLANCRTLIIEVHPTTERGVTLSCEDLVTMICHAGFTVTERRGSVLACHRKAAS